MGYRFQIARRYLAGSKRFSLISVITGISMTGVALGVAALIVVLSVMNGFYDFVQGVLVSLDPHVRITRVGEGHLTRADSLSDVARPLKYVERAAPYVEGRALIATDGPAEANEVVVVRGIDPATLDSTSRTAGKVGLGDFDLGRQGGLPGIVVGGGLARQLGLMPATDLRPASTVALLSAPAIEQALTQLFGGKSPMRFQVRGLYESEAVSDESRVFIALEEAQRLFRMLRQASGVELRLSDLHRADEVKAALQQRLDPQRYDVRTWYDLQGSLYDVMRLEKWGASAILLLIILVAAFNIVGSMMMVVIEKRSDIGVLKAMGVSPGNIRRIFLTEGVLIGSVGTGVGLVVGLGLALLQQHFRLVPMAQAESFLIDAYPVSIRLLDVSVIAAVSMGLCMLAALYPATRAAAVEPARAVQVE